MKALKRRPILLVGIVALAAIPPIMYAKSSSDSKANDNAGPLSISSAKLRQSGHNLVLSIKTQGVWKPPQLAGSPDRFLCVQILSKSYYNTPRSQICVEGRAKSGKAMLRLYRLNENSAITSRRVKASIARSNLHSIRARFLPKSGGISLGRFRWQLVSGWSGLECFQADPTEEDTCTDRYPDEGTVTARVRTMQVVGCKRRGSLPRRYGPRNKKRVALTFDDGPGPSTTTVLRMLRKHKARATFFVVGYQITKRPKVLRQILGDGNEIGNHSLGHSSLPSRGDLVSTSKRIRRVTRFKPCLFRPPYGVVNNELIKNVSRAGMTTILWDVDPSDWVSLGSAALAGRVLSSTHNGSIVLLHDGNGPRPQTVSALPTILKKLRSRGYRLVTVSELLGNKATWGPSK